MSEETEVASSQQNFITTGIYKETINFQWDSIRIREILNYPKRVFFQTIYVEIKDKSKWHFSLSFTNYPNPSEFNMFVNCKLQGATTNLQLALWEVFVINADGESVTKVEMNDEYKQENYFRYMEETQIAVFSNVPSVNGTVKLKGKLTIYNGTKKVDFSPIFPLNSFKKSSLLQLQKDMSDLLLSVTDNEKFADVQFSMEDGTVLCAHRGILVARSDYFRAMLSSGMMEQSTGKISIEGINGKAMKALLHFLYSGSLSKDWSDSEVLHDFTKAAHRYQIMALVEFLDANVVKVCDPCSAGDLLLLCKTLGMKTAEDGLRRLIKNNLKEVGGEPEFDDILVLLAKRQKVLK